MVRKDGAETRKERITEIARLTQAKLYEEKDIGWTQLTKWVTELMINTGLTKNKVMEILLLLADSGRFAIDENDNKISRAGI